MSAAMIAAGECIKDQAMSLSTSRLKKPLGAVGDRCGAIDRVLKYVDSGEFESELRARVGFRTQSQKKVSLKSLHQYLDDNLIPAFIAIGFNCRKYDNPVSGGGPFLLATRIEDVTYATVLGYGHGDVVVGQEECCRKVLQALLRQEPTPTTLVMTGFYWDVGESA